ncbi:gliding motility-associated C-terminal domain-containing protein [Spirosoma fluminis]
MLAISVRAQATHHVGGQIEMRAVGDRPGHFRIIATNYMESGPRADNQRGGQFGIFRKRDNTLMRSYLLQETGQRQPIIYANEYCAEQRNLRFIVATFETDIQLDPTAYDDPQGYYISYQTRNRNGGINNVSNPSQTGFTFYLEFPALLQNGRLFENSSPRFGPINGEYVCLGEPFSYPFGATDPDGDELRYSLVTPLDQKGNSRDVNAVSPAPYPDIRWLAGFSATNAIPGNPTLAVDAQTGQLTVTATQLGLYIFAVNVEEYRNGVKIGEVRRDFQLLVIECPPSTTPDPAVQIKDRPTTIRTATLCQGDSVILEAQPNPNWSYQWRRNSINLPGATNPTLAVRESGDYSLVVSFKTTCSKTGNSELISVNVVGSTARLTSAGHLCATTGSVRLAVKGSTNVSYQWQRNDQLMGGQSADSLNISQAGRYWATLTDKTLGCVFRTDSLSIERSAPVLATIQSATGQNRLCPQGTLPLAAGGGTQYSWQKDGQTTTTTSALNNVTSAGDYVLTATDLYGCTGVSTPFSVVQIPPITVLFDSIPPVCGPDNPVYSLQASPSGGEFVGSGVTGSKFNPKQAGIGVHPLTYTAKPAPECPGVVATRTAVVAPIPTIAQEDITTYTGNTFALTPGLTGEPNTFSWTPTTYLSDPTTANPSVESIRGDITYTLSVSNLSGCQATDSIHITVYERVWAPDAFSPNNDGLNDVWDLPGIEAFPDAVVTVFNRWGEVVYLSQKGYDKPFDGTQGGNLLPAGLYAYTLRTTADRPMLKGTVLLIR